MALKGAGCGACSGVSVTLFEIKELSILITCKDNLLFIGVLSLFLAVVTTLCLKEIFCVCFKGVKADISAHVDLSVLCF